MLRVGIIGAGQAGERQAVGFDSTSGAAVVAVADLVLSRAEELAGRYGAAAYSDWRPMLENGLDAVVVALPHNLHVEPATVAAGLGIHVMMEKPLATTLEDARRIINVCQDGGVILTVSFVHRFREEVRLLHGWLREGALGRPLMARETMNGQRGAHLPGWVEQREAAGGGVLMYSAIHAIDRLRWLLAGDVTTVVGQTLAFEPHAEVEHAAAALLTFSNGAVATLTTSAPAYPAQPTRWETEIFGSAGVGRARTRNWAEMSSDSAQIHLDTRQCADEQGVHYNFVRQAEAFVASIEQGHPPAVTAADALAAQEVIHAIYTSATTGLPVHLGAADGGTHGENETKETDKSK